MNQITPVELQTVLTSRPNATVLDVRTPVEFDEVHIQQARNVPLDALNPAALGLPEDQPVYLLCRSGQRATKAAVKFDRAGFTNPVVITGGTLAWVQAGLPVERGQSKIISLERQVRIATGSLVLAGILFGWLVNFWFFGVAGFVGAGLIFAGITDFCGMGLLLADALEPALTTGRRKPTANITRNARILAQLKKFKKLLTREAKQT